MADEADFLGCGVGGVRKASLVGTCGSGNDAGGVGEPVLDLGGASEHG